MKTSLVAFVIAFAGIASSQQAASQSQPAAPQQNAPATSAPAPQASAAPAAGTPAPKKEIKDPAEYNAYVNALQQKDQAAKISGLEAFLVTYPNSVMKEDALELLMQTYQQAGNQAKVIEVANRLLAGNPNNVNALVLLSYNEKGGQKWADAEKDAEKGLQNLTNMPKPDGKSELEFTKQKGQMGALLDSVAGFSALQLKDFPTAQKYLRAAVEADPTDVGNVYPLALSYLTAAPEDDVNGLFFIARAANLIADPTGKAGVIKFGHSKYLKYHGAEDGWNELLAQTATVGIPPPGFTIAQYVPPTPAQQAHDLVKDKSADDIKKMSFADWELALSAGSPEDADKVWSVIKGVALQMEGIVIKASPTEMDIAESSDDIDAKKVDITLTMAGPVPAKLMPTEGGTLDFQGTPASYTASPFMMNMENGTLLTKAKPAAPAHKAPVHRKPAAH